MEKDKFFLWYDNGTKFYDCASSHATLEEAIRAARTGWQATDQYITKGSNKTKNIVWRSH
jgi:hypothetical protein